MILLFLFILASISITQIIVGSSLFGPVRKFFMIREGFLYKKITQLITCHQCLGFWVGLFTYFIWIKFPVNIIINFQNIYINIIFAAFIFAPIISLLSDICYRFRMKLCDQC